MADAALEFLLNNLKELLLYHGELIKNTKSNIENLDRDLRVFRAFLKDSVKKRKRDADTRELVRFIRDVVYDVEDTIDAFVTQAAKVKASNFFLRAFKAQVSLHGIGIKVEEVTQKVQQSWNHLAILNAPDQDKPVLKVEARPARQKNVVGFVKEREDLITRLLTETDYLDVISVTGIFGLGKTTLARKIFHNEQVLYEFPVRIWLTISQQFSSKKTFLAILEHFVTISDDIRRRDEQELATLAAGYLESGKFLIVMDDVWNSADWDVLKDALPDHNTVGKIMITTRQLDVSRHASLPRPPYKLRYFRDDECWELLRLEALGKLECPPELEDVGQVIARDCQGIPLATVVIGGILSYKSSEANMSATRRAWDKVSTHVSNHLNEDPADRINKFISLSYNKLPYDLRACFLYLWMFPEDYEIPVSKLIRMWIGEGFIQRSDNSSSSLEETAEKYFEDLINRNLVRIEKLKPNGKVKTCRIHDALRDFCGTEAGNERENFLQEITYTEEQGFVPPASSIHNCRHLSLHSNYLEFFSSRPFGHRVRSFVCLSKDQYPLPPENSAAIPSAFKLLRVLDAKPIKLTKIHNDMYQLIHVRYMAISFTLSTLPAKFSRFRNIQTLIVDTTSRMLDVKADIWKMNQLRHFKTNAFAILPKQSSGSKHGSDLQTLGTVEVGSCTPELFHWAKNLKEVGIGGRLALLFEERTRSFDSMGKLRSLEKLKLINDLYPDIPREAQLLLPSPHRFPSGLRSLTLKATFLSWSNMSTLRLLENLTALKLKNKAFMGRTWEWKAVDIGFPSLEFLHIERTNLAVWKASSHHFSKLKSLVLRNCEEVIRVPIEMAEIPSFQMLDLHNCKSAAASARNIQMAKKQNQAQGTAFKLSIFPPDKWLIDPSTSQTMQQS